MMIKVNWKDFIKQLPKENLKADEIQVQTKQMSDEKQTCIGVNKMDFNIADYVGITADELVRDD